MSCARDIAIIGLDCRFPGAPDPATFWENLRNGVESVSFFTDQELLASGADPELLKNPGYVRARSLLTDVDLFDAEFFGYTPKREVFGRDRSFRRFLF
jgi:acyl transferase domain-containing protein